MKEKTIFSRDMMTDLSESRSFLMGLGILGIVAFHARAHCVCPEGALAALLDDIVGMGYGGCDLFFFLSGFGLAHSLRRDSRFGPYLVRRVKKLFPAYYPFILVYMAAVAWLRGITGKEILGNLTFLGFWFQWGNQFNWYIQSVMAFYLLAPVICRVMETWKGRRSLVILGAAALGLQVIFWGSYPLIAISRVPVFLLGMALGNRERGSTPWTKGRLWALVGIWAVGLGFRRMTLPYLTWGNGLYWYPFLLIAPAACLLIAGARPYWLNCRPLRGIDNLICLCGRCSYEIYLVHLLFFETILAGREGNLFWLAMVPVFTALGIGYHYGVESITRKRKKPANHIA